MGYGERNGYWSMKRRLLMECRHYFSSLFVKAKGRRQAKAIVYLNPAKVNGGISASPIFIITNEVDQRKVTRRARRIAAI